MRLALDVAIEKRETSQIHVVQTLAVISDSQVAIRREPHLESSPGQRVARQINSRAWTHLTHGIATKIHCVLRDSGIPGNEEEDRHPNLARAASGNTFIERPYTSASNRARRISEWRSAAKADWMARKCSNHFSYRIKGKAGTKRPIPKTGGKLLAARFYRLKSVHAPTGVYLEPFTHQDEDNCWWCGGNVSQTWEHLFCHCSRWKDQQNTLWKTVGQATRWKAGMCRHMQFSDRFTIEECNQAVMDFLAATEVEKFPPK